MRKTRSTGQNVGLGRAKHAVTSHRPFLFFLTLGKYHSSRTVTSCLEARIDPSARSQPQRSEKVTEFIGKVWFTYRCGGQLSDCYPTCGKEGMTGEKEEITGTDYVT